MRLQHLNLRVRDAHACRAFYEHSFGFQLEFEAEDGFFLRSADGFLLALVPGVGSTELPDGFHIGFCAGAPEEVATTRRRLDAAGVSMSAIDDLRPDEDYVTFRCWDPDGTEIEVYWDGA